ncbi:unnamed protein product [Zymoseptoria tritici ST99CH_1A5]|uniref:Golgi apparatus membrane protein TVP38 n=2 Tax=Zymoseptoria tritici TaxID=1047171 RepID=A0A2H1GHG4_ZYMTR|nr:unnamed protein product [Zymoseptoria tritici ST99CH_1E4]SMR54509.1 unnamed protein product [Zymoseptoria tritici ST99CH_3D1]SMY24738.1 unnamed protein product [Zymoseptoria tritici ST99CH_1A5]
MARPEYASTARALASQIDISDDEYSPPSNRPRSSSPLWTRRSQSNARSLRSTREGRPNTWLQTAEKLQTRATRAWTSLSPPQKIGLSAFAGIAFIFSILALIFSQRIFHALAPAAKRWHDLKGGWLILWFMTFFVSFPPMIGYSTCVTIAGFVFGLKGWFIVASATIIGSTASFLASRTLLKSYVTRLAEKDTRFAALSLVLKHDGIGLLCMIRLCPLPYSLSNGAISTIPSVTWQNFMLATAVVSPKLLLHVFIGGRLGAIAEEGDKMDARTKAVSYISIAIGMVVGVGTGYIIYVRTKARAKVLEAEEAALAGQGGRRTSAGVGGEYIDDSDGERPGRREDEISLHQTYEDDLEAGSGYRDQFTDDEDAVERDVFDAGDETEEEEGGGGGYLSRGGIR